ncbi:hypothetical protein [Jiella endophytica]|uniref:hypothetical protein n=1 Tax=Jiella endophytica TaxID=2558362 RepID=UPI0010704B35|nr:hypothetical protein [Jiella endophytica]
MQQAVTSASAFSKDTTLAKGRGRQRSGAPSRSWLATALAAVLGLSAVSAGLAQDADGKAARPGDGPDAAGLSLELNNAVDEAGVCRLSYVVVNRTGEPLEKISYDVVVFDQDQRVSRFLVLQFGQLPAGKTKVVQFDLADQPCSGISRILVNDVSECQTASGTASICMDALRPASRTDIVFDT